jgi:hypothetical protein
LWRPFVACIRRRVAAEVIGTTRDPVGSTGGRSDAQKVIDSLQSFRNDAIFPRSSTVSG